MSTPAPYDQRIAWFHQARFGLFVHWGLYSVLERGEWAFFRERIPVAEYEALADQFTGEAFDADALVRLAVASGQRYAVLTTRHHDGFCLWDSAVTDFTSVKRAAKRDFVREFVDACRRHGVEVGLYISNKDWRQPGYWDPDRHPESARRMVDELHAMVAELLTNYGEIKLLWFDGAWIDVGRCGKRDIPAFWRSEELLKTIYGLQPNILVNNRLGVLADLDTPEQRVVASDKGRGWEACMTIGDESAWGYCSHNPVRKTTGQLLRHLVHAVSGEGNFILNVGPRGDGSIPEEDALVLREMGEWLAVHGEAVYGTTAFPIESTWYTQGRCTRRGNTVYLHLLRYSAPEVVIPLLAKPPAAARLLTTGQSLGIEQRSNHRVVLTGLPALPPHPEMVVIALEFNEEPEVVVEQDHAAWLTGLA
ncbi:MAG: alpha-L-fucosidase [Planctomycetota bacterium]|jgi:alpha-L-fucosidase|nr:alpha-L-fucosidase [Planctomycetota bacterium]